MNIYHITDKEDWEKASQGFLYTPPSFEKEGFIHCSTKEQVIPTANRRYHGATNLVILAIDTDKVLAKIIFEDLNGRGEKHPHIYGPLPIAAVKKATQLVHDKTGIFQDF